jgi:multidrug efflux pump subunit AcrA (membrane-fusion protein)
VAIRVELNNVGEKLKPEMFARGEIHLGTRRLPVIPRAALVQDGAESFVMVRRGGSDDKPTYTRLAVQTVPANDPNQWAIVGGLAPGEQVVMEGSVLVERDYIQTQIIRGAASR